MSKFQIVKLSKCQSNCQIVTISNVMYYQSVWIRLAHRLYSDFQYFFNQMTISVPLTEKQVCQIYGYILRITYAGVFNRYGSE